MIDLGEKCAVFGIYGKGLDAGRLSFFGLYALQHRGQESSGIATSDGETVYSHKRMGLVPQVFREKDILRLPGYMAIGHNRYSTSKSSSVKHAQPVLIEDLSLTLVHNGNLPSTRALEGFLSEKGLPTKQLSDSEMIAETIAYYVRQGRTLAEAIQKTYPLMTGSFSILVMDKKQLIAIRDKCGIRPLAIGSLNGGFIFSSESCAFYPIGAQYVREVKPAEMGLIKNRYIHRTFIEPEQHIREQGVKLKLTPLPEVIKGKRVVVVDDSVVRGTTSRQIVAMLFEAGATEVNFIVSSPPVKFPDFYGIDTPLQKNLIAAERTPEEILTYLRATRLHYLSYEGLIRATELPEELFSTSCFTGEYPIDILERKAEIKDLNMKRMF